MDLQDLFRLSGKPGHVPYLYLVSDHWSQYDQISLERGFYFMLVTNGTGCVVSSFDRRSVCRNDLFVLTPGVKGSIADVSADFCLCCLYINPDYFDTLSVGQLVYNQVAQFIGNYQLPVFRLSQQQSDYLQHTLELYSEQLETIHLYRDGCIRHLCSFLLLQIADDLYQTNSNSLICLRRSSEIFRNFKRLLVHHYRRHHTICFYAEQLNISTTYLSRIVKKITGHTVCFHISELLYADACKLLACSDKEIKEIAEFLGFSDQSVFGKFFVRKTGVSPSLFRAQKNSGK